MLSFDVTVQSFETIIDFIRYGISKANEAKLYFGHGTDNAQDDITTLILESLSLPSLIEPNFLNTRLTIEEKKLLSRRLEQRIIARIPVPYLINKSYFCGLPFYIDERVLIPRSPIAELILNQFSPWIDADSVHHILEIGTGSGCIAIACCYAFPEAQVDAVDISADALEVAKLNQRELEVEDQLSLFQSDCFAQIPPKHYDMIVSNPPYVGFTEMATLPLEYRHEPVLALQAENNGIAIVEKILFNAHHYLSDHGILVVEVGNSEEVIFNAYPDLPFTWLEFERGGSGVFMLTAQQLKEYFA